MKIFLQLFFTFIFIVCFGFLNPEITAAASFRLDPAGGTFVRGCPVNISIRISTEGASSNAADVFLNYTQSVDTAMNIKGGTAYENYAGASAQNGNISMTGFSAGSLLNTGNEEALFGTLTFETQADSLSINFEHTLGNTEDSNVADANQNSTDVLTQVSNGSYSFVDGYCETAPPFLTNIAPAPESVGVPLDTDISFHIKDLVAGVDINTVKATITHNDNATDYIPNIDSEITFTGDTQDYAMVINPSENFLSDLPIHVRVIADDFAGNTMNRSFIFNHISCEDLGCGDAGIQPQCDDGIDNDEDGLLDLDDPGCDNALDNNEYTTRITECSDGTDNDNDGLIDGADPGCINENDDSETNADSLYACNDTIDNDGDGAIDLDDPDCTSITDNSEANTPQQTSGNLTFIPITTANISAFIAERTIPVNFLDQGFISSLAGDQITLALKNTQFTPGSIKSITLSLNNSKYQFNKNSNDEYIVDFIMPIRGNHIAEINIVYSNDLQNTIRIPLQSIAPGMIYDIQKNTPISEAQITLYRMINGQKFIFSHNKYRQNNPMQTNQAGSYGYVVPNGGYQLEISHPNFDNKKTATFWVTNNVIAMNYSLLSVDANAIAQTRYTIQNNVTDSIETIRTRFIETTKFITHPRNTIKEYEAHTSEQVDKILIASPVPIQMGSSIWKILAILNEIFFNPHASIYFLLDELSKPYPQLLQ